MNYLEIISSLKTNLQLIELYIRAWFIKEHIKSLHSHIDLYERSIPHLRSVELPKAEDDLQGVEAQIFARRYRVTM